MVEGPEGVGPEGAPSLVTSDDEVTSPSRYHPEGCRKGNEETAAGGGRGGRTPPDKGWKDMERSGKERSGKERRFCSTMLRFGSVDRVEVIERKSGSDTR